MGYPIVLGGVAVLIAAIAYFGDFSNVIEQEIVRAEVLGISNTSSEVRYAVHATVRLSDGSIAVVRARSFQQAQWFTDTVCLSKNTTEAGGTRYKLQNPSTCDDI